MIITGRTEDESMVALVESVAVRRRTAAEETIITQLRESADLSAY